MRRLSFLLLLFMMSCQSLPLRNATAGNEDINLLFENYWEERMRLFPLEATQAGDDRYNHLLQLDITAAFRDTLRGFYSRYLAAVNRHDPQQLSENDRISYDIFKREMEMQLEEFQERPADVSGRIFPIHLCGAPAGDWHEYNNHLRRRLW